MPVATTRRQLERRPQNLFKHLLFQLANGGISLSQFVVRAVRLPQYGKFPVNIHFHSKAVPDEARLEFTKPLHQRYTSHRRAVSLNESRANTIGHAFANSRLFDAVEFIPQKQRQLRVVVAQLLLPGIRHAIRMMRPTAPRSNRLPLDQAQMLEPTQPLTNCCGRDAHSLTQFLNRPTARLMKLLEKQTVTLFNQNFHGRHLGQTSQNAH